MLTIFGRKLPKGPAVLAGAAILLSQAVVAEDATYHVDGHVKGRFIGQKFPGNSIFNELTGSSSADLESDLRLNFEAARGPWEWHAAYQLFALYGDRVEYSRQLPPAAALLSDRLPNDRRRLFDMTRIIRDEGRFAALHRMDRAWFGYTGEKTVLRLGRQAISWGNGFFFSPMDIVNPFDPAAIDREYKAGDDMLYGQYLTAAGNDLQAALVLRRNVVTNDVESDQGTASVKFHGIAGDSEYDLLLARNYGELTAGVGGNRSMGGAVWRGDLVVTDAASSIKAQFVTNLSYSWMWRGKNVSGVLEYYFNGFGQGDGDYDPSSLAANPDLLKKFARGELFTLGRHYLAGGVTIEMNPLWTLSPNLFANIADASALLQFVTQRSFGDNLTFLGALNLPLGPAGTEYGGIETGTQGRYFSLDFGVFAQLAGYF